MVAVKDGVGAALPFRECAIYPVDILNDAPLLLEPPGSEVPFNALQAKDSPRSNDCGAGDKLCVAVLQRRGRSSSKGVVQWLTIPHRESQAEIVTVDAYALGGSVVAEGLAEAGIPGIAAANLRLEDVLNPQIELSRQTVASRTLALGRSYAVGAGKYHLILEDLAGSQMKDTKDVQFEKGRQYVLMRVGLPGSVEFPEQVVFNQIPLAMSASARVRAGCLTFLLAAVAWASF